MTCWWWRASLAINRALCGSAHEPLCARAHRRNWRAFAFCMDMLFGEYQHCARVHAKWHETRRSVPD